MCKNPPKPVIPPQDAIILPSIATKTSLLAASRKRPALLLILLLGLLLCVFLIPTSARISLLSSLRAQLELVILLCLFGLVTMSLVWTAGQRLDVRIFILLNTRLYPNWLDRLMWLATQLGSMLTAFIIAALFFVLNYRQIAIEVIFGTVTLWLLVELIKSSVQRERPFRVFETARIIGWQEIGHSFPSGHTSQIFFLVTFFIHHFQPGVGISSALYSFAALVGLTRIYVGAHYPRDVVAGYVLGSVWGLLTLLLYPN